MGEPQQRQLQTGPVSPADSREGEQEGGEEEGGKEWEEEEEEGGGGTGGEGGGGRGREKEGRGRGREEGVWRSEGIGGGRGWDDRVGVQ